MVIGSRRQTASSNMMIRSRAMARQRGAARHPTGEPRKGISFAAPRSPVVLPALPHHHDAF
ncbi:hypothetical protein KCP69_06005 [Salmonella enterica subsp. enterica]|nr:hypothetical protein KCP69_06005 [Salmonella enterica subsp. enterica]